MGETGAWDMQAKVDAALLDLVERDLCRHQLNANMARQIFSVSSDPSERILPARSLRAVAIRG